MIATRIQTRSKMTTTTASSNGSLVFFFTVPLLSSAFKLLLAFLSAVDPLNACVSTASGLRYTQLELEMSRAPGMHMWKT